MGAQTSLWRAQPRNVSNGAAGSADRQRRRRVPTRNSMTASADPARRREHDNSRDERGHAGIQQDFIENFNHHTLPHAVAVAGNLGEVKWLKLLSKSRLWQECTHERPLRRLLPS